MDKYSGKRAVGGLCVPKKSSSLVLRDAADSRNNGDVQLCSRIGCSGRVNYTKAAHIGSSMKSKSWRPSSHLASGKVTSGSSSNSSSIMHNAKKIPDSRRTLRPKLETVTSESSSAQNEIETQEFIVSPRTNTRRCQSELREAQSRKVASVEVGRSTIVSKARSQNSFIKRPGLFTNQDASVSSSSSSSSESTVQGTRGCTKSSRHGLRNLRTSITDALHPSSSLSESNCSKRRDVMKKRNSEGETSSSGGGNKKTSGQPSDNGHVSNPTVGFTFPDSRRNRDYSATRESGVASVRTRRLTNGNIRTGHSNHINVNTYSSVESSVVAPQVPQSERYVSADSNFLHEEGLSSGSSSYSHPTSVGNVDHLTTVTSAELGIGRLMNRDGLRRYNMDGIAEILLALERIERDEELTYEQLLALETNLFLGGLSFYDQHRDMRLDIDNMSYEELLALEERMGNVSTALSEDELLKSVTVSTYPLIPMEEEEAAQSIEGEDSKCSICQEEYLIGDEVGKIRCEHGYHMECIKQWLQLKNWCPICKAAVEPPKTS